MNERTRFNDWRIITAYGGGLEEHCACARKFMSVHYRKSRNVGKRVVYSCFFASCRGGDFTQPLTLLLWDLRCCTFPFGWYRSIEFVEGKKNEANVLDFEQQIHVYMWFSMAHILVILQLNRRQQPYFILSREEGGNAKFKRGTLDEEVRNP